MAEPHFPDRQCLMDVRKAVELAVDLPVRPMRHVETELAAFAVGICRAQQIVVPREHADWNETAHFKNQVLSRERLPARARAALDRLLAGCAAAAVVERFERAREQLERRTVAISDDRRPPIELATGLQRVAAGRRYGKARCLRNADRAVDQGCI